MPAADPRAEAIFLAATEIPDATARSKYLDEYCAGDALLKARVLSLLQAHDHPDSLLDQPVVKSPDPELAATRAYENPDDTRAMPGQSEEIDDEPLHFLAPSSRPDSLGKIGQYEVLEVLGKGGFGIVFRAFDDKLQRVVAVKVMAPSLATTSPARKRFLREARSSAAVRHENVVQVHAVEEQPLPHLVMEFVPGETLQQRLDRTGPLDTAEVLKIGRQIAEGLAAAHATGLIHRDIKPSNILVDGGANPVVKITDFGLARAADDASLTRSGVVAGTPMYMAPEQAKGEPLDHRADLFSLGSVLYVLASGRPPFRASSTLAVLKRVADDAPRPIREIIPEVPEWLCRIIEKLHAKDPEQRYQKSREVADTLKDCEEQLKANGKLSDYSRIPGVMKKPRRSHRKLIVGVWLFALAMWGAIFFGEPAYRSAAHLGAIEIVPQSALMSVTVWKDGRAVFGPHDARRHSTITLEPGRYKIEPSVAPGRSVARWELTTNYLFSGQGTVSHDAAPEFDVPRGASVTVRAVMRDGVPEPPPPPTALDDGWVQLFNGKDLTGWKTHPQQQGTWEVKDGILVGSTRLSHLFTDRYNFTNFHLRVELKINKGGDSGIRFRTPFSLIFPRQPGWRVVPAGGYGVVFTDAHGTVRTGSIRRTNPPEAAISLFTVENDALTRPDEWQSLEVIASGNRTIVKIDGSEVANGIDPQSLYSRGHIALQCLSPQTIVQFRKIEIKELPAPSEPGWESLFNGKDLTEWKTHPKDSKGAWKVKDGYLAVEGADVANLFSQRSNYSDFHLRIEAKCGSETKATVGLRAPFAIEDWGGVKCMGTGLGRYAGRNFFGFSHNTATKEFPIKADEWFTQEWILTGDVLAVKLNGEDVAAHNGIPKEFKQGHLLLSAPAGIQFRKIEIKELQASSPEETGLPASWRRFPVPGAGFSVMLPANPESREDAIPNGATAKSYGVEVQPGHALYVVSTVPLDAKLKAELTKDPDEAYRRTLRGAINNAGIDQVKRITFGGLHGAEVVTREPTTGKHVHIRLFVIRDHVGILIAMDDAPTPSPMAQAYFNSLKVEEPTIVLPRPMRPIVMNQWGTLVDPTAACKVDTRVGQAAFSVPGDKTRILFPKLNMDAPRWLWDTDGDFTYQVTVQGFPWPKKGTSAAGPGGNSYREAGFLVWVDENNFVRFGRAGLGESEDGQPYWHAEGFVGGERILDERDWVDGPLYHLQVERRGGSLVLRRSIDGSKWTDWRTIDKLAMPPRVKVGLIALNNTTEPFHPVFENLATGVYSVREPAPSPREFPGRSPIVAALAAKLDAKQKSLDTAKARYKAGTESHLEVTIAELEVIEAKIQLAEAEGNSGNVAKLADEAVTKFQAKRDFVAAQVADGRVPADSVNAIDAEIADAKVRQAKAREKAQEKKP